MNQEDIVGAHETNLDWLGFVRLGNLRIVVRISTFLLATFVGSPLIHALEHPMIVIGNKAAAAINRKRIPANVQTDVAIAGVRA